jgi:hypothetical protein
LDHSDLLSSGSTCRGSRKEITVSKCARASHISDKDRWSTHFDDSFQFRWEAIPNLRTAGSMRYLSASIAARRIVKFKLAKVKSKRWKSYWGRLCPHRCLLYRK